MHTIRPPWLPVAEPPTAKVDSCDACGACCMQQGHPPFSDEELLHVAPDLKSALDVYLSNLEMDDSGKPCVWLDLETRRCLHYEDRPQICRDFERGSAPCTLVRWRYRIGVHMPQLPIVESCDGCGVCCLEQGHPPFTNDERDRLPYELLAPIDEHLSSLEKDDFGQPCLWFDPETKQCSHYEHRPQMCRDFQPGSEICVHLRLRYKIGRPDGGT